MATMKHMARPVIVGSTNETAVHFQLCVSFLMVRQVVEQGKCMSENSIVHRAVSQVQSFCTSSAFNWCRPSSSRILPVDI